MYKFGTIVLIPFPFTDLTSVKLRPALIISAKNHSKDVIVSFITSVMREKPKSSDFIYKTKNKYFEKSGLKVNSVFRFDKIATLNKKLILGEIGTLHPSILVKMKKSFSNAFGFFHK